MTVRFARPRGGHVPRSEQATASLELVLLAPLLLMLFMLIIAFSRYAQTENLVDQASRDATRAATAQNDRSEVLAVAQSAADEIMADAPPSCRGSRQVSPPRMSDNAFDLPDPDDPLDIATVSITVRCRVDLSDLAVLPLPSVDIERSFTSPLDRYRGYQN